MAITFSRSTAALRADGFRRSLWMLSAAIVLLALWGAWFFFARVALYETTSSARMEVGKASHSVQAPVSGRLEKTRLVLGRQVKAGELLVELESTAEKLQLEEQQARVAALKAQLGAMRNEIVAEERALAVARSAGAAALAQARARARERQVAAHYTGEKARRLTKLHGAGHMAELDYLKARADAKKDRAALDTAGVAARELAGRLRTEQSDRRANLEKLRTQVTRTGGELATVKATVERLEHDIDQRRIRAPISGELGEISKLVSGAYVQQGDFLAAIVPEGRLSAVAGFPPAVVGRIRPGQPARLRLHGFPWTQYGSVRASVKRVASETHNSYVRVELELHPDPDSPIPLQHGLPGEVEVEVERVSPATLVLRAAGKLLTVPAQPRQPRQASPVDQSARASSEGARR